MDINLWRKIKKNFLVVLSGDTGASIFNFLTLILTIKIIGDFNYGVVSVVQSYVLIITLIFSLQSWQAIVHFGTKYIALNDYRSINGLFMYSLKLDILFSVISFIIGFFTLPYISLLFNWNQEIQNLIYIYIIVAFFNFSSSSVGILRMLDKFGVISLQKVILAAIKLLLVTFLYIFEFSNLNLVVIIYVIFEILSNLLIVLLCLKYLSQRTSLREVLLSKSDYKKKEVLKFTMYSSISSTFDVPVKQFDTLILSRLSFEMVAVYKVFKQIVDIFGKVASPITQSIMPQFSMLIYEKKYMQSLKIMNKIRNIILITLFPILLISSPFIDNLLKFFFGDIYSRYSIILIVFIFVRIISLSYVAIHPLFISMGHVKLNLYITLFTNIFYIGISLYLVNYYSILGLILAYTIQFVSVIILKLIVIYRGKYL